ncbi:hypothetical protein [Chitinophaga barathri]|uniref:DUF4625 domain-containing protein n=1 Tax=Chitinophaga barathri TaxID=1647451 RepID=A0A3N4MEG3_9BACT|nr:hypothetical protein [Chitinophaga barathri]RPD40007.1 hypothetical protein EG028_17970 [Chitinophaga barathri]
MKKIILLSAIAFGFFACKKEGDSGKRPILTFKSVTMEDIPTDVNEIHYLFDLQDGDGDTEGEFFVTDIYRQDSTKYDYMLMPGLESHSGTKLKAELTLIVSDVNQSNFLRLRGNNPNPVTNPDTSQLKVYIVDKAGNVSDTLRLPKVAIHY